MEGSGGLSGGSFNWVELKVRVGSGGSNGERSMEISDFVPVKGTSDSDATTQNSLPALSNACKVEASRIKYCLSFSLKQ